MAILAGAFSCNDNWDPGGMAANVAKDTCRYPAQRARLLVKDGRLACYVVEREGEERETLQVSTGEGGTVLLAGRVACPKTALDRLEEDLREDPVGALSRLEGLWQAVVYTLPQGPVRLISDWLGFGWLYVGRCQRGYIFSADFGAVARNLSLPLTVNDEAALASVCVGYSPDNQTCFHEITMVPPGGSVELLPDRIRTIPGARPEYGDGYVSLSQQKKFEILDQVYRESLDMWTTAGRERLIVSLSEGNDSRYVLALAIEYGVMPPCLTFGHPRSPAVRASRALCDRLDLQWSHFYPQEYSWDSWQRCVEQLGAVGGFHQWAGWADQWCNLLASQGNGVLVGLVADTFSGKHLEQVNAVSMKGTWRQRYEAWSVEDGWRESPLLRQESRQRLTSCVSDVFSGVGKDVKYAFPHQEALHLDLYGRQRRFGGSQANLLLRFLAPISPFASRKCADFWSNLPYEDLEGKALYLAYARSRFPRLFGDSPRPPTLPQRLWGTLKNQSVAMFPALKNVLKPTEVDTRGMVICMRREFAKSIRQAAPMMGHLVDTETVLKELDSFPRQGGARAPQILRLVNLAVLLRLGSGGASGGNGFA